MCSDAETEPPGTPAQLGGEGRKDVRDRKSGGKKRRDRRQGCGRGSAVVAAAASQWGGRGGEEEWGREGEGRGRGEGGEREGRREGGGEGRGRETDAALPPSFRRTAPPQGPALGHPRP